MPSQPPPFATSPPRQAVLGPPPELFSWTRLAERGGTIRLVLAGELDLAGRGHLKSALDDAQSDSTRVILDLRALTLIDCACLHVLVAAAKRCRDEGAVLILELPRGQVRRVLDLVGAPPGACVLDHEDLPGPSLRVAG